MDSVLLFPDHPELRLYRLEPQQVKADFLAHCNLAWILRTLPWKLKRHVINWRGQIDLTKVIVGEPTLQPSTEPMSVDEVPHHLAEVRQRIGEDRHLSKEEIEYRVKVSLNALWAGHQEHYFFTLSSNSGRYLVTVGTAVYSNGGGGFLFYQ